ncbi:MAG: hypothetical protein M3X11_16160 [Acidobacteriota bacterium]|nr:hypothetical protein [Acidobacteriota bacterium]
MANLRKETIYDDSNCRISEIFGKKRAAEKPARRVAGQHHRIISTKVRPRADSQTARISIGSRKLLWPAAMLCC